MAVVQFLVFATLYSSLFAYAIFLYVIRSRQRMHRLERPVGYRIPYSAKELPQLMFFRIKANLQASKDANIGPRIESCHQPGWGDPASPLSDHHFKGEILKSFRALEAAAVAVDPSLAWPPSMTARQYIELLLGNEGISKTGTGWMSDNDSDPENDVSGMVIGQEHRLPKHMAPYVRALVSVYDLARFTEREFSQNEWKSYMKLLWTVTRCFEGKACPLGESDIEWTLGLTPDNGPK